MAKSSPVYAAIAFLVTIWYVLMVLIAGWQLGVASQQVRSEGASLKWGPLFSVVLVLLTFGSLADYLNRASLSKWGHLVARVVTLGAVAVGAWLFLIGIVR